MSRLSRLRRELAKLNQGRGRKIPASVRARVTAYVVDRRESGATWSSLSSSLGVSENTLRRWAKESSQATPTTLVPVVVSGPPRTSGLTLVTSRGHRVEGLDAETLRVLLPDL